jgi:hypothetical protein
MKSPIDFTAEEAQKVMDLFVTCCRVAQEVGMDKDQLVFTLVGFATNLDSHSFPLQYYLDHPKGLQGRDLSEKDMDTIRGKLLQRQHGNDPTN